MSNLLESYRVLGVKVGAGMADVTTSYRQLCRAHHPDVTDNPDSEELMKQINIAYTVLREKFRRETAFRERQTYSRPVKRYPAPETRQQTRQHTTETWQQPDRQTADPWQPRREPHVHEPDAQQQAAAAYRKRAEERAAASADAEKEAYSVLHAYFAQLNNFNYSSAYEFLSEHDKKHITKESFIKWRKSVARLYPMREFKIAGGSSIAVVTWGDNKTFHARKFRILITEDNVGGKSAQTGDIDKLVINEDGNWGVFLGYKEINALTRSFDKRFETKKKLDFEKRWQEYYTGLHPEFNMLNIEGMRAPVMKELYRHRRYGGSITFTAISVLYYETGTAEQEELLQSAAKTICDALREIDIPAYAGDGIFAILFVELGRKNAQSIVRRLIETIRKNAGPQLCNGADIEYELNSWSGNNFSDLNGINDILKKFSKKI